MFWRVILSKVFGLLIISIGFICLFVLWAVQGGAKKGFSSQKIVSDQEESPLPSETLKVISWNIAWSYGMGSEGVGYTKKNKSFFIQNLQKIADVINDKKPDVVLLQEIDFDSDRSYNIDQLAFLAKATGLGHYAYAKSWEHNYVPFPYWPIKNQFGKVKSGAAIMGRFPIVKNEVFLHEKPKENPFWYNMFYLYRISQFATLKINGTNYTFINNHLEAFSKENREKQAELLSSMIKAKKEDILIVAGDFNTTPPNAKKKADFIGYPDDDYQKDKTYSLINDISFLSESVPFLEYAENEKKWFTFSSDKATRRLDYIFVNKDHSVLNKEVIQTKESDHLPFMTTLKLNKL